MNTDNTTDLNRAVVTRFLDGTHGGRLDVIDETVAPTVTTHGFPGGRNPHDRASYKDFFRAFGAAFSGMRFETTAMVAEGDRVAVRFVIEVRHTGEYAGVPATGRSVRFSGMALYRLSGGMIRETWLQVDERAILEAIGAIPLATGAH